MPSYAVNTVRDDPVALREALDAIGEGGGKIISIMWAPDREVGSPIGRAYPVQSGYTVVAEYPDVH
jgi:hypothetical protein